MPSSRGITRSAKMMAGRNEVIFDSASCPSMAASALNPHVRTSSVKPARADASSSTTRIRLVDLDAVAVPFLV